MGYSLREFEREVPPANREFHISAERIIMHKEGLLPLDPDERDEPDMGDFDKPNRKKIR